MNAPEITTKWTAALLGACRLAQSFLKAHGERFQIEAVRDEAKSIREQIARAADNPSSTLNFQELSALVLSAPGVEWGFIQQTAWHDMVRKGRAPGATDAWLHDHVYFDQYRVFIHTGTKFREVRNTDLLAAIREAFEFLNLPLPKGFPA